MMRGYSPLRIVFTVAAGLVASSAPSPVSSQSVMAQCTADRPHNDWAQIRRTCTSIIENSNSRHDVMVALGQRAWAYTSDTTASNRLGFARRDLDIVVNLFSKYPSELSYAEWATIYNTYGGLEAAEHNYNAALPYLDKAIDFLKKAPRSAQLHVLPRYYTDRAYGRRMRGDFVGADQDYGLGEQTPYNLLFRAYAQQEAGNKRNADAYFRTALAGYQRNYEEATSSYDRASALRRIADIKGELGITGALDDIERAEKIVPKESAGLIAGIYNSWGQLLLAQNRYKPAIVSFSETIKLDSSYSLAYANRAEAYLQAKDLRRAQADLMTATRLNPYLRKAAALLDRVNTQLQAPVPAPPQTHPTIIPIAPVTPVNPKPPQNVQPSQPVIITQTEIGTRRAFLVGNQSYPKMRTAEKPNQGQLVNPVNDIRRMADVFSQLNFKVTTGYNLSKQDFTASFKKFAASIEPGDFVVVYYSGHGASIEGINLLIPTDFDPYDNSRGFLAMSVTQSFVVESLRRRDTGKLVFISDACRDNPFTDAAPQRGLVREDRGYKTVPISGTVAIYSAAEGQTASDGPSGGNSPFVDEFAPVLLISDQDIVDIVRGPVREGVERRAKRQIDKKTGLPLEQWTAVHDEARGKIYFRIPAGVTAAQKALPQPQLPTEALGTPQTVIRGVPVQRAPAPQ